MSEPKGSFDFDTAIYILRLEEQEEAAKVLEDWPKWERIIKAAGKVDKENAEWVLCNITDIALGRHQKEWETFYEQTRALLKALPEPEDERK